MESRLQSTVRNCLRTFLDSTGRSKIKFDDSTNLICDLGLSSDEGVDFVLDLCDAVRIELPKDFNPFVHDSGRRGRSVSEMIERVDQFVTGAGAAA